MRLPTSWPVPAWDCGKCFRYHRPAWAILRIPLFLRLQEIHCSSAWNGWPNAATQRKVARQVTPSSLEYVGAEDDVPSLSAKPVDELPAQRVNLRVEDLARAGDLLLAGDEAA